MRFHKTVIERPESDRIEWRCDWIPLWSSLLMNHEAAEAAGRTAFLFNSGVVSGVASLQYRFSELRGCDELFWTFGFRTTDGRRFIYERPLAHHDLLPCELPVRHASNDEVAEWVREYRNKNCPRQLAIAAYLDNDDSEYVLPVLGGGTMRFPGKHCAASVFVRAYHRAEVLIVIDGWPAYEGSLDGVAGAFVYDLSLHRLMYPNANTMSVCSPANVRVRPSSGAEPWWDQLPPSPVYMERLGGSSILHERP